MTAPHSPVPARTASGIAFDYLPGQPGALVLLFLHAGVADRRMWDEQSEAMAGRFGLLRVDLRGFGDSDTDARHWSHATDVAEVLDGLDVDHVHVVSASFGAGVGVQLALAHPERVRSLVLAPVGGAMLLTMTPAFRAFVDAESAALDAGDVDAAVEQNVTTWVVGHGRTARDVPADVCDRVRVMQRRAFELADRISAPSDGDDEPFERAAAMQAPTLIIVGAHDLDTGIDAARQWASALPNVDLEQWDDVAHLPSLEQPKRFTARLTEWLVAHGD